MQSTIDKFETTKDFVRLWRHEMHKVIYDRLMTHEDRTIFEEEIIPEALKKDFSESAEFAMMNPILYGDFLTVDPGMDMIDQWRLYEDVGDYDHIKPQWVKVLDV